MAQFAEEKLHEFAPIIDSARETLNQANTTARSANDKTSHQVERVNDMVTGVLDWTATIGGQIERRIGVPGRKIGEAVERVKVKGESIVLTLQSLC